MEGTQRQGPDVQTIGIYVSATAAALIWVLQAIGNHANKRSRQQRNTHDNIIARSLWSFSPAGGRCVA